MDYNGRYIYAIAENWQTKPAGRPKSLGKMGLGGRGDDIYFFPYKDIGAFISRSPMQAYQVSRENAIAHEKAIEEMMKHYTLLPMQFSMLAQNEDEVRVMLEKSYDELNTQLHRLDGKKELGLKGIFPETIFKDILSRNETIQKKKAELEKQGALGQNALIEIGKMVEDALNKEKETNREAILAELRPIAEETKVNAAASDRMFINAAFLVNAAQEVEMDKKVSEIAERYTGKFKLKYVGNLPPYNFLRLVVSLKNDSAAT
jgi:hypothetical protein